MKRGSDKGERQLGLKVGTHSGEHGWAMSTWSQQALEASTKLRARICGEAGLAGTARTDGTQGTVLGGAVPEADPETRREPKKFGVEAGETGKGRNPVRGACMSRSLQGSASAQPREGLRGGGTVRKAEKPARGEAERSPS